MQVSGIQEARFNEETLEDNNIHTAVQSNNENVSNIPKFHIHVFNSSTSKCSTKCSNSNENFSHEIEMNVLPNSGQIEEREENVNSRKSVQISSSDDSAELAQRRTEINAAVSSLKTNLLLCVTFLSVFLFAFVLSLILNTLILTILKGLIPVVTTITNFGKVQQIILVYWESLKTRFQIN